MPSCPRSHIIAANEVGIYHCYNRCVRRAFLCGFDPVTGQSYEHRKEWIQLRLELLAVSRALGYGRVKEMPVTLDYQFSGSGVRSAAVTKALIDTAAIFYRLRILRTYQRRQRALVRAA